MAHTYEQVASVFVGQQDMACHAFFAVYLAEVAVVALDGSYDCQDLELVQIGVCFFLINAVYNGPAHGLNIAMPDCSHFPNNLQLSRRRLRQNFRIELQLKIPSKLINLDKWIRPQSFLIPLCNQCFQTEITKHHHMSPIDHSLSKSEDILTSLVEALA